MTALGRIPYMLLKDADTVWLHNGVEGFGGGGNRNYLIHMPKLRRQTIFRMRLFGRSFLCMRAATPLWIQYYYDSKWEVRSKKPTLTLFLDYAKRSPIYGEDHAESFLDVDGVEIPT